MAAKKTKLAELKTKESTASVEDFLNTVKDEQKRKDSFVILEMMKKASGEDPKMWGSSIIGFGNKRYKSPTSGREVEFYGDAVRIIHKKLGQVHARHQPFAEGLTSGGKAGLHSRQIFEIEFSLCRRFENVRTN